MLFVRAKLTSTIACRNHKLGSRLDDDLGHATPIKTRAFSPSRTGENSVRTRSLSLGRISSSGGEAQIPM
jgi:hypothetical protein